MGFVTKIFSSLLGAEPEPVQEVQAAEPEPIEEDIAPDKTEIDPQRDIEISSAAKKRKQILARRGRSSLLTSKPGRGSGVSVAGAATSQRGTT